MKIRQGFVSNSSSSSFIILLPVYFDIAQLDIQKAIDAESYGDTTKEEVEKYLKKLIKNGGLWYDECYQDVSVIQNLMKPYCITTIDVSSDGGNFDIVDLEKVKKILKI